MIDLMVRLVVRLGLVLVSIRFVVSCFLIFVLIGVKVKEVEVVLDCMGIIIVVFEIVGLVLKVMFVFVLVILILIFELVVVVGEIVSFILIGLRLLVVRL